jgi:hypothetical protein
MSEMNPRPEYAGVSGNQGVAEPVLSTPQTLSSIFFEPGRVFESFRTRPRFLVAGLIIILSVICFQLLFIQRLGFENIVRSQIETRMPDADPAQREQIIEAQTKPVFKVVQVAAPIIVFCILFAAGAGLYLLGTIAMGKTMTYKQALSVWIYSSLPRIILFTLANIILLFIKSPDDIDIASASRGLVHANPSILVDGTAHPVIATALGSLDLFAFYALFLAALGLRKVARLSSGAAWTIVISLWLVGVLILIGLSALLKTPMA